MKTYKEIRDEFMQSEGTTAYETLSVILPSAFLCFATCLWISLCIRTTSSNFPVIRLLLEFNLIIIPIILNVTLLAEYATTIITALFVLSVSLYFTVLNRVLEETDIRPKRRIDNTKQDFVTLARATVNVMSVVAILAVDFQIFPRTFSKTKNYGYSLMDTGVGLYVFVNGIVAPEIKKYKYSIKTTLQSVLPLIVIGIARFVITKEINYHVPVLEYGVHWNFFITLAAVRVLSSLILSIISVENSLFSGVSTLLAHEILLQLGLAKFVLDANAERDTFFKANKEGIVSTLGYVGLYFLSVSFGRLLHINKDKAKSLKLRFLVKLCFMCLFLLWATLVLQKNFGVSRRLANSGYCIWILFIGILMVTLFYLGEFVQDFLYERSKILSCVKIPLIYEAINYNGLVYFLVANLLTGFINIVTDTLKLDTFPSLIIIVAYMLVNCILCYILFIKKIKLKL